jgi:plastocyanin
VKIPILLGVLVGSLIAITSFANAITEDPTSITESPFAPNYYKNSITPAVGSGTQGCETTSTGCYIPNIVTITVGDVVTFYNSDTESHTFSDSVISGDGPNAKFDTGLLTPGESFEFFPDEAGNIQYFCTLHPWMRGAIIVQHSNFSNPS